jgi:CBS domain-containing protein
MVTAKEVVTMRCEEIMKTDLECCGPTDDVQKAARKMRDANVGFIPICDDSNKVLGTLTDRDLAVRLVAEGKDARKTKCQDVMTRDVVWCRPQDDLRRAEELMAKNQKSRILICDDDQVLRGVISLSDLVQHDASQALDTMRQITDREAQVH